MNIAGVLGEAGRVGACVRVDSNMPLSLSHFSCSRYRLKKRSVIVGSSLLFVAVHVTAEAHTCLADESVNVVRLRSVRLVRAI